MSSFREIAINIIPHDTLLGRSMSRINTKLHDELAKKMAEFEQNNTVKVYPMGASAESVGDPICKNIIDRSKKANARAKTVAVIERKKRSQSGYQNLVARKNDLYTVFVGDVNLGMHKKDEAIRVRDEYRVKNNLPAAEY